MGVATSEWITLATEGARRFDAFVARPERGHGSGLVILHDMERWKAHRLVKEVEGFRIVEIA